jgi:hypothetical protein
MLQLPASQSKISHLTEIAASVNPLNWNASNSIFACGSTAFEIIVVVAGSIGNPSSMMTYS